MSYSYLSDLMQTCPNFNNEGGGGEGNLLPHGVNLQDFSNPYYFIYYKANGSLSVMKTGHYLSCTFIQCLVAPS